MRRKRVKEGTETGIGRRTHRGRKKISIKASTTDKRKNKEWWRCVLPNGWATRTSTLKLH